MEMFITTMLAIVAVSFLSAISRLQHQVNRLQKKTDAIAEKLGIEETIPPELEQEINQLIDEGNRIKAIKVYRQSTGEGLKEASDFIHRYIKKRTS